MADIIIKQFNDVHMRIDCDRSTMSEMSEFFTFNVPGAKFHPKVKAKMWDGKIRLLNQNTGKLYRGLINYVHTFAKMNDYTIESELTQTESVNEDSIDKFIKLLDIHSGGNKIELRDYQVAAVKHSLNKKRALVQSPTSSGKSAVIYTLTRWHQATSDRKTLIIVPTISLVTQMFSDFNDYSSTVSWQAEDNVHCITAGVDKNTDKDIVISTWQSLQRMPKSYYDQYDTVIQDECHLAKASALSGILEKMTDCPNRYGFTGTVQDAQCDILMLCGLFGDVKKVISTKELMDRKEVAALNLKALQLVYSDEEKKNMKGVKYHDERAWINGNIRRSKFIAKLAAAQKKNTLLLFNIIEHGEEIFKLIQEELEGTGRKAHFVSGKVGADERENIRQWAEKEKDSVIVASSGVYSTGVSIKNLHTVIFAAAGKSKIQTLQSIGRGLRMNKEKTSVILYDIVDDLSWKSHKNFSMKHFLERTDFYSRERFDVSLSRIRI